MPNNALKAARLRPLAIWYTVAIAVTITHSQRRRPIDVGGSLPRRRQQFFHDRLQLLAGLRLGGADLAGAQGDREQVGQQASSFGLAQAIGSRQHDASGLEPRSVLASWRGAASGPATARTSEAVATVLGDDGPNGRHVPDLMTQRLRVVAKQRLLAMAADRRFAVVDGVGVIDEGTLGLGVPVLTACFVGGRWLGWGVFDCWRVRGRWPGGVAGVLVEALLEFSHLLVQFLKPLLVPLHQRQDGCLGSGRNLFPQLNRDRRNGRHTSILRPLEARAISAGERIGDRNCRRWYRDGLLGFCAVATPRGFASSQASFGSVISCGAAG